MKKINQKIVSNKFKWVPMNERHDNLGLPLPPRKPETQKPLLWIAIEPQDGLIEDVYLVNETGETLEAINASTVGFESLDDDYYGISGLDIEYKNIANNDAVKIEEYHQISDSDSVLIISIKVKLKGKLIKLKTSSTSRTSGASGFKEEVLLWG